MPPRCKKYNPPKMSFNTIEQAEKRRYDIWSSTNMDMDEMADLLPYPCTYGGKLHYHLGHRSYYEKSKEPATTAVLR